MYLYMVHLGLGHFSLKVFSENSVNIGLFLKSNSKPLKIMKFDVIFFKSVPGSEKSLLRGYPLIRNFRFWQDTISNDILRSKIGPIAEKLSSFLGKSYPKTLRD